MRTTTLRFGLLVAAAITCLPAATFGLARLNTDFALPAGLANDVVRIRETTAGGKNFVGTGTIFMTSPDGSGGMNLCILTADHVVRDPANANLLATSVSIGFRFDQNFPFSTAVNNNTLMAFAPVDLAVFKIDVPQAQLNLVPSLLQPVPIIAADTKAGNQIVQAGYGNQATAGTGAPAAAGQDRYLADTSYGTYLAATNTITGTTAGIMGDMIGAGPGRYTFNSLDGTFAFTKDAMGNFLTGTSYILSGDSGGPTFESNGMGGLALVGVHSFSQFRSNMGQEFNIPGDQWHDVNASQYAAFINGACTALTPEPASLGLLAMSCIMMGWRRRLG